MKKILYNILYAVSLYFDKTFLNLLLKHAYKCIYFSRLGENAAPTLRRKVRS